MLMSQDTYSDCRQYRNISKWHGTNSDYISSICKGTCPDQTEGFIFSYNIRANIFQVKLMKGKALRKHSLHKKTAASVLLKLFISSNE